jgi:hypothetical protein
MPIKKIGGGGSEKYMILVPIGIGFFISVYALGGPLSTLRTLEYYARNGLDYVINLIR